MIVVKNIRPQNIIYQIWGTESIDAQYHREDGKILFANGHSYVYLNKKIEDLSKINFKLKNTLDII